MCIKGWILAQRSPHGRNKRGGVSWRGCSGAHGGVPCRCLDGGDTAGLVGSFPAPGLWGTGLYVKCLTEGLNSTTTEDRSQRSVWERQSLEALLVEAEQRVPEGYASLTADDRQNPRRLIRLLERGGNGIQWQEGQRVKLVGLQIERARLHQRIQDRVEQMYADGLLDEAALLPAPDLSSTARQAIGYAEAIACLAGEYTQAEAVERTVIRTRQLAKRQMTWFRNQMDVEWIEVEEDTPVEAIADAVEAAWARIGAGKVQR